MSAALPHADLVFRVAAHEAAGRALALLPAVDTSWRRCLNDYKLDPAQAAQPLVLGATRLRELHAEHADLVNIARAEMDSLYEQISGSGYALLLADTAGVILCERIDPGTSRLFSRAGLIVGAEWSEQREGTNGIGTCVTERRPITIHQSDHFRARHTGLSCSAAPIHDPFGHVIAVLDASSVNSRGTRESQLHTVALVNASARLIEKCLFLRRHQGDTVLRFHYRPEFVDLLHDGAIAVAGDGTIVAADLAGLRLLGTDDRTALVGRAFSDVFDAGGEALGRGARAGERGVWELRELVHGNRYYASVAAYTPPDAVHGAPLPGRRAIVRVPRCEAPRALSLDELAGDDPQMLRNLYNARRVVDCPVAVLISGPAGSGKETFARAMHLASQRAAAPFVAVDCAAVPAEALERALFGHDSGAEAGRPGLIRQSCGGTLFLDAIGELPLALQGRLLRVLEEPQVAVARAPAPQRLNLRLISASHRDLRDLLARGALREDLYYRLRGVTLEMPALASRRDKDALVRRCIAQESPGGESAAIEVAALERLVAYHWPGNIRELRSALRAALVLCEGRTIRLADLPLEIRRFEPRAARPGGPPLDAFASPDHVPNSLEIAERRALLETIEQNEWHMTRTAAVLGLSRNTLYRMLKRHGIRCERGRQPA